MLENLALRQQLAVFERQQPEAKAGFILVLLNVAAVACCSPDTDFIPPARFADIHQLVSPLDCALRGVLSGDKRSPN